ncbi:MAG: hypothetical protein KDI10_02595, partial [Halioglobus sp.]|nr:hypothetical protein [Halioglobus sp.]
MKTNVGVGRFSVEWVLLRRMLYYDADWTGSESGAPGLGGYHMKIAVIVVVVVLAIILFRLISSPSKSKSGPATAARKARVARATATAAEA